MSESNSAIPVTLRIGGMTCATCATRVERALSAAAGVLRADVHLVHERASILMQPGTSLDALREAVERAGYEATLVQSAPSRVIANEDDAAFAKQAKRDGWLAIISAVLSLPLLMPMTSMLLGMHWHVNVWLQLLLASLVQFWLGARFYRAGAVALRSGTGSMDTLIALGTSAAYFYSLAILATRGSSAGEQLYLEASAAVITLVRFGKWIESRAKRSTTAALRGLLALQPERATVRRLGRDVEVAVEDVCTGELVVVRPGERLAVDGLILEGESDIDESLITGESLSVVKHSGDSVTCGTLNGNGLILIQATKVGEDSTLARIVELVYGAQRDKAHIQHLVDKVSTVFVPSVLIVAAITIVVWWSAKHDIGLAIMAAVSVLVIACPCALGLATPTAIVAGMGAAARAGILVRDVEALECAAQVDTVIFDKTGTVTEGHPKVVEIFSTTGNTNDVLQEAASVQQGSLHPLAKALLDAATNERLTLSRLDQFENLTGRGVKGNMADREVVIGNAEWMQELGIELGPLLGKIHDFERRGLTSIVVAKNQSPLGIVGFADPIRSTSAATVLILRQQGRRVLLLSGDSPTVVAEVGRRLGVDESEGRILPEGKQARVRQLQSAGHRVAMVGDGLNDAPALAAADIGIAVSGGTDVAQQTARVILMRPDPILVVGVFDIASRTMRKIRHNIFLGFPLQLHRASVGSLRSLKPDDCRVGHGAEQCQRSYQLTDASALASATRRGTIRLRNIVSWFDSLRKASLPGIWSQGVRIARTAGNVVTERRSESEVTLRVRSLGDGVVPTVTLYLEDEEWSCDCGGTVDPCAHITAAAVAIHNNTAISSGSGQLSTPDRGRSPTAQVSASDPIARKLVYCLWSDPQGLALSRELLSQDGTTAPLRTSLNDPSARVLVKELMPREQDMILDRLIGTALGRYRLGPTQLAVLTALEGAFQVSLDGRRISVSTDTLLPRARVTDANSGVQVELDRPAELQKIVGPGIGMAANVLRPLAETELSGLRWEKLPSRRYFGQNELGELVAQVLPRLQRRMIVDILTDKLPGLSRHIAPNIVFELSTEGDTLIVSAHLVYGKPPLARVENDRLIQLGATAPRRDIAAESTLAHQLRDELDLLIDRPFCLQGIDAAQFSQRLKLWQQRHGIDTSLSHSFPVIGLFPEILYDNQSLSVRFISNPDNLASAVSAEVALRAFGEGLSQVPLANGIWGELPFQWLATHGEQLTDLLAAQDKSGVLAPAARVALVDFLSSVGQVRPRDLDSYAALLADGLPDAIVPSDLNAELRSYQRRGINWLFAAKGANVGAILADDMGLGKTLQALSIVNRKTLVVCPRSVVHNWISEAKRFRPRLKCAIYHGQGRALDETQDLTVTTYALLRLDNEDLNKISWDTVILDEAQTIKNPESQAAQAACALHADFRLALTGTPIENRLEELWSLMHFTNPGVLGTLSSFKTRFSGPIAAGAAEPAQRLRSLVRPFVMRRHKRDVLPDLPPRTDDILWVELDESERNVYNSLLWDARNVAVKRIQLDNNLFAALEALLRLRQAACHLGLLPNHNEDTSSKVDRLVESVEEIVQEGHRAIVFSQWTSLLSRIEPPLISRNIEFARLDGTTRDRQSVVEAFQSESGAPVLLASLQAGGTGLNLTGADHVFLTDPWWNPAVEDQAASRAHRIGQKRPVFVHRMVAKDTVEERIIALQQRKRELGNLLDGADPTTGLSRDELLELLE